MHQLRQSLASESHAAWKLLTRGRALMKNRRKKKIKGGEKN